MTVTINKEGTAPIRLLAPLCLNGNWRSGKHKGKPKRRIVRHPAKTNLSAICPINIRLNPDIRSIYERMSSQGKPKGVIFNRIKCLIVRRMFAVIRRGTPFEYRVDSSTL